MRTLLVHHVFEELLSTLPTLSSYPTHLPYLPTLDSYLPTKPIYALYLPYLPMGGTKSPQMVPGKKLGWLG